MGNGEDNEIDRWWMLLGRKFEASVQLMGGGLDFTPETKGFRNR